MATVFTDKNMQVLADLTYAVKTDVGQKRNENQDNFVIVEGEGFRFFCVADGMGGAKSGGLASQIAVDCLKETLPQKYISRYDLSMAVEQANKRIYDYSQQSVENQGMGTTLVGLCFTGLEFYIVNVGDSRAYRLRNSKLEQLTVDHSLVQELIKAGAIKGESKETNPISHMLTRSLGPAAQVEVDCIVASKTVCRGDIYLLCSDGLYNMVSEEEITAIISQNSEQQAVDLLVQRANQNGGADNITVLLIKAGNEFPEFDSELEERELNQTHPTDTIEFDSEKLAAMLRAQKSSHKLHNIAKDVRVIIIAALVALFLLSIIVYEKFEFGSVQPLPLLSREARSQDEALDLTYEKPAAIDKTVSHDSAELEPIFARGLDFYSEDIKLDASLLKLKATAIQNWKTVLALLENAELSDLTKQTQASMQWAEKLDKEHKARKAMLEEKIAEFRDIFQQFQTSGFEDRLQVANSLAADDEHVSKALKDFQEISWSYLNSKNNNATQTADNLRELRTVAANELAAKINAKLKNKMKNLNVKISELLFQIGFLEKEMQSERELEAILGDIINRNPEQIPQLRVRIESKLAEY